MTARSTMLPVALTVAVLAVGCGGDDDSGDRSVSDAGTNAGANATPGADRGPDSERAVDSNDSSGGSTSKGRGGSDSPDSGGSETPSVETSSITKAEFVKQAQAICREERKGILKEISAYLKKRQGDKPAAELYADMFRDVMVPTVETEIERVRALGAPPGDAELLAEIFDEQADAIDRIGDLERVKSTEEFEEHFAEVDKKIRAYGFIDCTNSTEPALEG